MKHPPSVFSLVLLCCSIGCSPMSVSGGGGYHSPPKKVYFGEETVLDFKVIIRGDALRGVSKRYTEERVYFRVKGESEYRRAITKRDVLDNKTMIIHATIPSVREGAGDQLEYFFTHKFDGYDNSWGSRDQPETVPIERRTK